MLAVQKGRSVCNTDLPEHQRSIFGGVPQLAGHLLRRCTADIYDENQKACPSNIKPYFRQGVDTPSGLLFETPIFPDNMLLPCLIVSLFTF